MAEVVDGYPVERPPDPPHDRCGQEADYPLDTRKVQSRDHGEQGDGNGKDAGQDEPLVGTVHLAVVYDSLHRRFDLHLVAESLDGLVKGPRIHLLWLVGDGRPLSGEVDLGVGHSIKFR